MIFNNLFKTVIIFYIICISNQLHSTVKIFVNDSSRTFMVRVYDNDNNIIAINLVPGAIQELFIPGKQIDKIVIQDKGYAQKSFGTITDQILYKESSKINENITFIIHQNGLVKMYQSQTQKHKILETMDTIYTEKSKLPTLDILIHTKKSNQPWVTQDISYEIKYPKSLFESIGSIFS